MTVTEFVDATGMSDASVRGMIRAGRIAARKLPYSCGLKFYYDIPSEELARYRQGCVDRSAMLSKTQALHRQGASIDEIANAIGKTRRTVFRYLNKPHLSGG